MDTLVPEYRYFTADVITGSIVMEVPFQGVSWERKIGAAGAFSGSIAVPTNALDSTRYTSTEDHFDLYNTTLPGKHALYVIRDGECVWGGIIWSREYDIIQKTLNVDALEFSSYLYHRVFWKSFATDTYQAVGNTGPSTDSETLKDFLAKIIECVNEDQNENTIADIYSDDPYAYLASDIHCRINSYEVLAGSALLTSEEEHGFSVGQEITIGGVSTEINGTAFVTGVPNSRQFYVSTSQEDTSLTTLSTSSATYAVSSSVLTTVSRAANINIEVDIDDSLAQYYTEALGDDSQYNIRGSALYYVGELLQGFSSAGLKCKPITAYADTDPTLTVRFDYFIESKFYPRESKFINTFKAWKVNQDLINPVASGSPVGLETLYGPSLLGANRIVFEHPGNISELKISETAESAATRFWMVDSGNDLPDGASKYYGSYTNLKYLEQGWPLLEVAKSDTNLFVTSDEEVAPYAKQYAYKLSPPVGYFSVSVNGSVSPTVNTYKPGDWCVVIPNDAFIQKRLSPPYESRSNILVRKIRSMKVSVPDNPAFPEVVNLELIPEWEVSD